MSKAEALEKAKPRRTQSRNLPVSEGQPWTRKQRGPGDRATAGCWKRQGG